MRLLKVTYNLFESDVQRLDCEPNATYHVLDREIVLLAEDFKETYISWIQTISTEGDVIFAISYQETSFFINEHVVRDMTNHPFWHPLIEQEFMLSDIDPDHQILEIKTAEHSVYCSSYENGRWGVDVVHVSLVAPSIS